jgi:pimeloyl-ACP methyl ester carboxylesterase
MQEPAAVHRAQPTGTVAAQCEVADRGGGDTTGLDGHMTAPSREQTRARYPDECGRAKRDGVQIYYEAYGNGEPTILFLPAWEIVHSRAWKCQIPYFARHGRVVTFDRRGNGRSDRPLDIGAYGRRATVGDTLAVLDKAGVERAAVLSWCGAGDDLALAAEHPDRVAGLVLIAPDLLLTADPAEEEGPWPFNEEPGTLEGWAKWNRHYWLRDWPGFLESSSTRHSPSRTPPSRSRTRSGGAARPTRRPSSAAWTRSGSMTGTARCGSVRKCRVRPWSSRGREDAIVGRARGAAVAAAIPQARLITLEGSGHAPQLRDPVITNLLIRDFVSRAVPRG